MDTCSSTCNSAALCFQCLVVQLDDKHRDSLATDMLHGASAPAAGLSSPPKLTSGEISTPGSLTCTLRFTLHADFSQLTCPLYLLVSSTARAEVAAAQKSCCVCHCYLCHDITCDIAMSACACRHTIHVSAAESLHQHCITHLS